MAVLTAIKKRLGGSKQQIIEEPKVVYRPGPQDIVPLRLKQFHTYATGLIGTKVYDSPQAEQILGVVDNFLFSPVKHDYDNDSDGKIVGIKISDSKIPVLNPESVYWWLDQKDNRKFAVLKGMPEPEQPLEFATSIGDRIRCGSRKLPLIDAIVYGSIFGYASRVDRFPGTRQFPSEYEFIDEVYLDYGDKTEPKRWVAIKRQDVPKAIDFKNKVLLTKPHKLGLKTKEEIDKILEDANTPQEGGRCWG